MHLCEREKQMDKAFKREFYYMTLASNTNSQLLGGFDEGENNNDSSLEPPSRDSQNIDNDDNSVDSNGSNSRRKLIDRPVQGITEVFGVSLVSPERSSLGSPVATTRKAQTPKNQKVRKSVVMDVITYENSTKASGICMTIINQMSQIMVTRCILCRHLALICNCFTVGTLKKTDFGTYRVELIISLFGSLKDLHNFELVLSCITPEEHGMLLARLGFLNLFNPLKPEGCYRLDLSSWEQRQVLQILIFNTKYMTLYT
jgi:hypothetical protein